MKNVDELLKLVKKNPLLDVIPLVHEGVVCSDYAFNRWMGTFGRASIREYLTMSMYDEDRLIFKDDMDDLTEYLIENFDPIDEADINMHELAEKQALDMEWKKAIFVDIDSL